MGTVTAGADTRFWDKIAHKYAQKPISDTVSYQHRLNLTKARLDQDMRVLEVGCGTGATALHHAWFVKEILATDVSPAMISIARARAANAGVANVTFAVAGVEEVAFTGFDAILGLNVLHLLRDWKGVIARAYDALPYEGLLITSTPCLSDAAKWLPLVAPTARACGLFPPVLSMFTGHALVEAHREVGFDVEMRWQPSRSKPLFLAARKV